jgi:hypothetical protein
VRQEVGGLTKKVDPQIIVLDPHMHVHAANQETAAHMLQVPGDDVVALFVGVVLAFPGSERVGRCGDRR